MSESEWIIRDTVKVRKPDYTMREIILINRIDALKDLVIISIVACSACCIITSICAYKLGYDSGINYARSH